MNTWRQLLLQVLLRHRAQGNMWITWGLLGTAVLPLVAVLAGWAPRVVGATAAGAALSIAVVMWWAMYLQTAMRMNTPASACLVPGMRRHLLALTALLWLAASLAPALLFGIASGHHGYMLLACAAALQYIALCCRYPWLGFLSSFAWLATRLPWPSAGTLEAVLGANQAAVALAGLLALAAPGFLVLRVLFPKGGDAHFRIAACLACQAGNRKAVLSGGLAGGLFRMLDSFYHARLRSPGRPATRLLDALGGRAHWSRPVVIIALLTAGTLAWRVLAGGGTMRPFIQLLLVSMLLTVMSHVDGLLGAIGKTQGEQGILRLAPAAPPTGDLNRQLALALLRRFGFVFAVYLACSGAVVLATDASWRAWLCCTVVALAFTPLLLRDHARRPGWRWAQFAAGLLMLVMAPLSGMAEYGAIPLALVIGGSAVLLAVTVIALALRWRGALAAAPAFPAGRLAG